MPLRIAESSSITYDGRLHDISIGLCTYRRPNVLATIESIATQLLPKTITPRIIVVDNDISPSAKSVVQALCEKTKVELTYIHAPARNISVARNAAMDAATTRWLAFIDDDECASPNWLFSLYAAREGATAVFGRCIAVYQNDAPSWIRHGDYHSSPILDAKGTITTGYTSNVLIDINFVRQHGLRFDETLGRTGGEDVIFFHTMFRQGARLKYAFDAVVYEDVVPSRINLGWIAKHRYRSGQTYALTFRRFDTAAYRRVCLSAPFKIGACAAMFVLTAIKPTRAMWWLLRGVFHCGVLSYSLGIPIYQEYGKVS